MSRNFAPCPDKPNCVSTKDSTEQAKIAPIKFTGTADAAKAHLKEVVLGMKGARLVEEDGNYLRFEFTSGFFRFVDDVEFVLEEGVIHFRSASRTGHSDFGVNRKRMESIRSLFGG